MDMIAKNNKKKIASWSLWALAVVHTVLLGLPSTIFAIFGIVLFLKYENIEHKYLVGCFELLFIGLISTLLSVLTVVVIKHFLELKKWAYFLSFGIFIGCSVVYPTPLMPLALPISLVGIYGLANSQTRSEVFQN